MDITIWDFVQLSILNFLEFSMVYLVVNNIINFKLKETMKKISLKIIGIGLFHSVATTTLGILFVVGYLQMAASLSMVFWSTWMILKLNKKKKPRIDHTILAFLITQLIGQTTIAPLLTIVGFLNFNQNITHLLTFLLGLIAIAVVCSKIDFNKLFIYVARKILMKLMLFFVFFIFIIAFAIFGFNATYIVEYITFFLVFTIIVLAGIMMTAFGAQTQTDDLDVVKVKPGKQYGIDVGELPEREVQKEILVSHPRIVVKHQKGTDSVYVDNIMYIELCNRKTKVMLENGQEFNNSMGMGINDIKL